MFKHYLSQYLKTIASYYYKENSNFNYLLSSQDTKLSATGKLSNKTKHATYRKFNLRQNKSSRRKLKHKNYTGQQLRKEKEQLIAKKISMQILRGVLVQAGRVSLPHKRK